MCSDEPLYENGVFHNRQQSIKTKPKTIDSKPKPPRTSKRRSREIPHYENAAFLRSSLLSMKEDRILMAENWAVQTFHDKMREMRHNNSTRGDSARFSFSCTTKPHPENMRQTLRYELRCIPGGNSRLLTANNSETSIKYVKG